MADNNLPDVIKSSDHKFIEPIKEINDQANVNEWLETKAFYRLMRFIELTNESVVNRKISDSCHVSEVSNNENNNRNKRLIK